MKSTYLLTAAGVGIIGFFGLAWWSFQPVHRQVATVNQAPVIVTTVASAGENANVMDENINATDDTNVNAPVNSATGVNTNSAAGTNTTKTTNTAKATNTNTTTQPKNANTNVNVNAPTNTSVPPAVNPVTTGTVQAFFASTVNSWRPTIKTDKMPNGRTIVQYGYSLPIGSHLAQAATGGVHLASVTLPAATDDPLSEVVSSDTWNGHVPSGHAFMKVNWFCSAALTHLTNTTGDVSQLIGDFTGDCNNPNVSVKGNFLPMRLADYSPSKPLKFHVASEHQTLGTVSYDTNATSNCVIDRIRNSGTVGVYAMQYTCSDGYFNGSNIQFTIYVFPNNWSTPADIIDLLTTADKNSDDDGDGLTYAQEIHASTNPNNADSDYDGLTDAEELSPYLTNPNKADSDSDGVKDGAEVAAATNPLGDGPATDEQLAAWGSAPQAGKTVLSNITATYAAGRLTVSWKSSLNADGIINWGSTADYGQYQSDYAFSTSHGITFSTTAGQTVHYAIRSCTPAPKALCTVSSDLTYIIP